MKNYPKNIVVEHPDEVFKQIVGLELINFELLPNDEPHNEAYCADEEILMEFSNGKEIRIYINSDGNCVYTQING